MNNNNIIPTTTVLSGKDVREGLKAGIDILADAVSITLGARGSMVGIERGYENIILRDGVSVAKAIWLENKAQRFGANVLRESAQKTVDEVGDGTTATIILARAIYSEAEKMVATGINPRALFDEINQDVLKASEILKKNAIPVTTLKQKIEIATISAEEEELGKLIGETLDKLGDDGVLSVDKSKSGDTYVEHQEGMRWDKGLASPYFINDPDSMTATLEDCPVLVTDLDITNMQQILPLLEDVLKNTRIFAIIAPSFGGDMLPSMVTNKMQNKFLGVCIKAPGYGEEQSKMLEDLAILTGAQFITQAQGHNIADVRFTHFGKAERITSDINSTLVAGGAGDKKNIGNRIIEIKKEMQSADSDFKTEKLRERLAKLTNGVAVIKVGGKTDIEIKERFERALDAALATREAIKKGIVAGGETAYLNLIPEMKSVIIQNALKAPFEKLVSNAGFDAGQMLERVNGAGPHQPNEGIDVTTGFTENMITKGIIDPVAVPIAALNNAASVALQLLGTKVLILKDEPETK